MTDQLRPEDELRLHVAERLRAHRSIILSDAEVHRLACDLTEGWTAKRTHSPNSSDHPLTEPRYGHRIRVNLPFVPETDIEREAHEARSAARTWVAAGGPPTPGVTMLQMLRQDTWWRMRDSVTGGLAPIRIEDMHPDHRVSALAWLHDRSTMLHRSAGSELLGAPDDVWTSYETQNPLHWLEEQELYQALQRWTTPYGEAPLTWRPMDHQVPEAIPVMVRFEVDSDEGSVPAMRTLQYDWTDLHYTPFHADPVEWRELRDDEMTELARLRAHDLGICDPDDCLQCQPR